MRKWRYGLTGLLLVVVLIAIFGKFGSYRKSPDGLHYEPVPLRHPEPGPPPPPPPLRPPLPAPEVAPYSPKASAG